VPPITNISTYRFAALAGLKELRAELTDSCKAWNLKGTILLSTEGINLFVAGAADSIDSLLARLRAMIIEVSFGPMRLKASCCPTSSRSVRI
jgi:predicted sulfurtransferase